MPDQTFAIPATSAGHVELMGRIEKGTGDRLDIPEGTINIGGNGLGYILEAVTDWDPVDSDNHDGSVDSLDLGDDVYIYAVQPSDSAAIADVIASKNSTFPTGYDEGNSRKIGGFHYGRVRADSERFDSTITLPIQIIPNSVWDLTHRPKCDPTGMVEVIPGALWSDIYLASEDGASWPETMPLSRYDVTPLTGSEGYSRLDYARLARNAGKRLPSYQEFMVFAYGVPQGATDAGDRVNTGQHNDYGFDCVSSLNVDQPSGNIWQQTSQYHDRSTDTTWNDDLNTGKDSANDHGQWRGGEFRTSLVGGRWGHGAEAGSRCVLLDSSPWSESATTGFRAVCDSL